MRSVFESLDCEVLWAMYWPFFVLGCRLWPSFSVLDHVVGIPQRCGLKDFSVVFFREPCFVLCYNDLSSL